MNGCRKGSEGMNKVILDKDGKVFVNGVEVEHVESIATKTSFAGTKIVMEFDGNFKSDYSHPNGKAHPLDECAKG